MTHELEELAEALESFLGQRPYVTQQGVSFTMVNEDSSAGVWVEIIPCCIPSGHELSVDGVHIMQTFCTPRGDPVNLKRLLEDKYKDVIEHLYNAAYWGKLEFQALGDGTVILVHDRFERVTRSDLEPDEHSGVSELHCKVQMMLSEWHYLNDLLSIIRKGKKNMEAEVMLLTTACAGEA